MDLVIRSHEGRGLSEQPVEVVERKGIGHPDTVCDAIAEHISVRLCRHYLDRFGSILHHNVDKILLYGGSARVVFGGGEVTHPIEIYLGGRATSHHRGTPIPVHDIAVEACREWLTQHLRGLDVDRHVKVVSRLRPGSSELVGTFTRGERVALANDTSCGAGFAPLTELERAVLTVERTLNDTTTKRAHPEIGEDVKVMGIRRDRRIHLTVGCAFVSRHVADLADYASKKDAARELAATAARTETALDVEVTLNAADDLDRGELFLTVTGTSAEAGDDGQVGRGNRACGLITPYRPMTLEAAAGKNPVNHVGKLYNLMATRIAGDVVTTLEVRDASCVLVSAIGRPIDDPLVADVSFGLNRPKSPRMDATVRDIVRSRLEAREALQSELLAESVGIY